MATFKSSHTIHAQVPQFYLTSMSSAPSKPFSPLPFNQSSSTKKPDACVASSSTSFATDTSRPSFPNMSKLWSKIQMTTENCVLSEEKLAAPPSLEDGMSIDVEQDLRYACCELIQSSIILLKLPQVVAATAQMLFHRFYYSKSFVRYNPERFIMASVNLALQIEEEPRRPRDVINVFHHLKQLYSGIRHPLPLPIDADYVNLRNELEQAEYRLLGELGYCVHMKHPHKLLFAYMKILNFGIGEFDVTTADRNSPDFKKASAFLQKVWNYMSDSYRSNLPLRYPPEVLACVCIHLASLALGIPLPRNVEIEIPTKYGVEKLTYDWWDLFVPKDISVPDISRELWRIYNRKHKRDWYALIAQVHVLRDKMLERRQAEKLARTNDTTPNPQSTPVISGVENKSAALQLASKRSPYNKELRDSGRKEDRYDYKRGTSLKSSRRSSDDRRRACESEQKRSRRSDSRSDSALRYSRESSSRTRHNSRHDKLSSENKNHKKHSSSSKKDKRRSLDYSPRRKHKSNDSKDAKRRVENNDLPRHSLRAY